MFTQNSTTEMNQAQLCVYLISSVKFHNKGLNHVTQPMKSLFQEKKKVQQQCTQEIFTLYLLCVTYKSVLFKSSKTFLLEVITYC